MDTGRGTLAQISPAVAQKYEGTGLQDTGIFHVGEVLIIKGSKFRVLSIGRTKMKIKILKQ